MNSMYLDDSGNTSGETADGKPVNHAPVIGYF